MRYKKLEQRLEALELKMSSEISKCDEIYKLCMSSIHQCVEVTREMKDLVDDMKDKTIKYTEALERLDETMKIINATGSAILFARKEQTVGEHLN